MEESEMVALLTDGYQDRLTAGSHERHVLTADDRMSADNDFPPLSGQTVGEHLRFDDTDPGRASCRPTRAINGWKTWCAWAKFRFAKESCLRIVSSR